MANKLAQYKIVTPFQKQEGYLELHDGRFIRERCFEVVQQLADGNFIVINPGWRRQESETGIIPTKDK